MSKLYYNLTEPSNVASCRLEQEQKSLIPTSMARSTRYCDVPRHFCVKGSIISWCYFSPGMPRATRHVKTNTRRECEESTEERETGERTEEGRGREKREEGGEQRAKKREKSRDQREDRGE